MQKLSETASLAEVIVAVNSMIDALDNVYVRDRGPKSSRAMNDLDAWRVKHGDFAKASHKDAAEALGLSYGQVYSARGEYTFKHIKKDQFSLADVTSIDEAKEA